jgi:deoxyribodipyrimidine photo-lyase
MPSVLWFRRDLRLQDNPALVEAAEHDAVLGVFVLDRALTTASGAPRLAVLYRTLRVLNDQLGGRLVIRTGRPEDVLPDVCSEIGADAVYCAQDFGPYGRRRDDAVADWLADVELHRVGSPYAVPPGSISTGAGTNYQVYSPFYRAWRDRGWPAPVRSAEPQWLAAETETIPDDPPLPAQLQLPEVGEPAARSAWSGYLADGLEDYPVDRDRPDLNGTSRMSVHLKWGTIHPRTMLADLAPRHETYRKELAWREFYADVLFHRPETAREYYRPELKQLQYQTGAIARRRLTAWQQGRTGYPIVDAGMRQLLAEGWIHNRVRMIVASFLVKDLHLEWTEGARHFLQHLIDADLASNNHGWQWVAGTGTDPSPYYRIFNPSLQGKKFDPNGDYVRRYVPELAAVSNRYIHQPWTDPNGAPADYPQPIIDHAEERAASLADYQRIKG